MPLWRGALQQLTRPRGRRTIHADYPPLSSIRTPFGYDVSAITLALFPGFRVEQYVTSELNLNVPFHDSNC
jgi:hypothetical protein